MPKLNRRPFTTVDDERGHPTRYDTPQILPPREHYKSPAHVPQPVRQMFRAAHNSGLTTENLATIYDLPIEWMELFVRDPGYTEH